jgi:hypothetical protein
LKMENTLINLGDLEIRAAQAEIVTWQGGDMWSWGRQVCTSRCQPEATVWRRSWR